MLRVLLVPHSQGSKVSPENKEQSPNRQPKLGVAGSILEQATSNFLVKGFHKPVTESFQFPEIPVSQESARISQSGSR